ncbi:tetratricopeptide repeat protein [Leptolyngbya sp. FACHB-36]|uniref:tetratricopeptide repeat protein n=1 Tax=Leptolyngbya sp. FACHB-36 TaxID=2692808 RepID=UPI0016804575|nr:tetratricopeptide repeat protein [Leptolyngbya sp. FACHB-36]MBD2022151.1 tetratricopeptide repeat protein [Leptolyngbya sp. FACHB-36]
MQRVQTWLIGVVLGCLLGWGWNQAPARSLELPTLAEQWVQTAQTLVRYLPNEPDGYNQLATAYLLKSRETGDFSYTARAETAVQRSLELSPDNEVAQTLNATLLLTYHRFQEALDYLRPLQTRFPHSFQIQAGLVDALVELGDYDAAIDAAQSMLDRHPIAPAYARMSYLRSLHSDTEGAIAAMRQAIQSANRRDPEGLAWYHVQLGNELLVNRLADGEQVVDEALRILPNYHLALAAKARARLLANDATSAIALYHRALEQIPLPDTAIALGDVYFAEGDRAAAQRQYDLVDFLVQAGGVAFEQAYAQQLAVFWADRGTHLDKAEALMRQERLTRSDVYTFDALAWCLWKRDQRTEARVAIDQALRLGTPDARLYYHAGVIYHGSGQDTQAVQYLRQALRLNLAANPLHARIARDMLEAIAPRE